MQIRQFPIAFYLYTYNKYRWVITFHYSDGIMVIHFNERIRLLIFINAWEVKRVAREYFGNFRLIIL